MELLKDKLIQLVYDYSINGKYADEKFVNEVITLFVNEKQLNDYVKNIKFDNENINFLSEYDFSNKTVCINLNKEINYNSNRILCEDFVDTKFERFLKVNLSIVNAVVHELTHAFQYKTCLTGYNYDLERDLLELSLRKNLYLIRLDGRTNEISDQVYDYLCMLEEVKNDDKFYTSLPSERLANLSGLKIEKDLSEQLVYPDSSNIKKYCDLRYLKGQLLGYDLSYNVYSPTPFVMTVNDTLRKQCGLEYRTNNYVQNEMYCKNLAIENKCSLDEKLYYGLPIDEDEVSILMKKEKDLQKKLIKNMR